MSFLTLLSSYPTSFCTCSQQWSQKCHPSPTTCDSHGSRFHICLRCFGMFQRPIQSHECFEPGSGTCHRSHRCWAASLTGKSCNRRHTGRHREMSTHCPRGELARERACICTFAQQSCFRQDHPMASYVCSRIQPRMYRILGWVNCKVRHTSSPVGRAALEGTCSELQVNSTASQLAKTGGSCNRPCRATCSATIQCTLSHT